MGRGLNVFFCRFLEVLPRAEGGEEEDQVDEEEEDGSVRYVIGVEFVCVCAEKDGSG